MLVLFLILGQKECFSRAVTVCPCINFVSVRSRVFYFTCIFFFSFLLFFQFFILLVFFFQFSSFFFQFSSFFSVFYFTCIFFFSFLLFFQFSSFFSVFLLSYVEYMAMCYSMSQLSSGESDRCVGLTFQHRNLVFKFQHTLYVKCE